MLVHKVQILTDRGTYVDYCPILNQSTFEFLNRESAIKAMTETQRKTKGHGFQYRVVTENK